MSVTKRIQRAEITTNENDRIAWAGHVMKFDHEKFNITSKSLSDRSHVRSQPRKRIFGDIQTPVDAFFRMSTQFFDKILEYSKQQIADIRSNSQINSSFSESTEFRTKEPTLNTLYHFYGRQLILEQKKQKDLSVRSMLVTSKIQDLMKEKLDRKGLQIKNMDVARFEYIKKSLNLDVEQLKSLRQEIRKSFQTNAPVQPVALCFDEYVLKYHPKGTRLNPIHEEDKAEDSTGFISREFEQSTEEDKPAKRFIVEDPKKRANSSNLSLIPLYQIPRKPGDGVGLLIYKLATTTATNKTYIIDIIPIIEPGEYTPEQALHEAIKSYPPHLEKGHLFLDAAFGGCNTVEKLGSYGFYVTAAMPRSSYSWLLQLLSKYLTRNTGIVVSKSHLIISLMYYKTGAPKPVASNSFIESTQIQNTNNGETNRKRSAAEVDSEKWKKFNKKIKTLDNQVQELATFQSKLVNWCNSLYQYLQSEGHNLVHPPSATYFQNGDNENFTNLVNNNSSQTESYQNQTQFLNTEDRNQLSNDGYVTESQSTDTISVSRSQGKFYENQNQNKESSIKFPPPSLDECVAVSFKNNEPVTETQMRNLGNKDLDKLIQNYKKSSWPSKNKDEKKELLTRIKGSTQEVRTHQTLFMNRIQNSRTRKNSTPLPNFLYSKCFRSVDQINRTHNLYQHDTRLNNWKYKYLLGMLTDIVVNSWVVYCEEVGDMEYWEFREDIACYLISLNPN